MHKNIKHLIILTTLAVLINTCAFGKTEPVEKVKEIFTTGLLYIDFDSSYTYGIKFKHKVSVDGHGQETMSFPFQKRLAPGNHVIYIYREYTIPKNPKLMDQLDLLAMQAISTANSRVPKENLDAKIPVTINKFKTTRVLLSFKTFSYKNK